MQCNAVPCNNMIRLGYPGVIPWRMKRDTILIFHHCPYQFNPSSYKLIKWEKFNGTWYSIYTTRPWRFLSWTAFSRGIGLSVSFSTYWERKKIKNRIISTCGCDMMRCKNKINTITYCRKVGYAATFTMNSDIKKGVTKVSCHFKDLK